MLAVEGWPISNIRDGGPLARSRSFECPRNIYPRFRQHLGLRIEIQRWHRLLGTNSFAAHYYTLQRVWSAKHAASARNVARLDQPPNFAAGDDPVAPVDRPRNFHVEPVFVPQINQSLRVTGRPIPEPEV